MLLRAANRCGRFRGTTTTTTGRTLYPASSTLQSMAAATSLHHTRRVFSNTATSTAPPQTTTPSSSSKTAATTKNKNKKKTLRLRSFDDQFADAAADIHWYPGHMRAAVEQLRDRVRKVDVVLEVRDARLPFSSANPLLDRLAAKTPRVVVFNKADLLPKHANDDYAAAAQSAAVVTSSMASLNVGVARVPFPLERVCA
jgi:hypothetical protein